MGILRDQANRLLRTKWKDPNQLAEEIWAILNSEQPVQVDSPLQVTYDGDGDAMTVTKKKFANPIAEELTPADYELPSSTEPVEETPEERRQAALDAIAPSVMHVNEDGIQVDNGEVETREIDPTDTTLQTKRTWPSVAIGSITGGAGKLYTVRLRLPDAEQDEQALHEVTAEHPLVVEEDVIAVGTMVTLIRVGTTYYITNIPVWME